MQHLSIQFLAEDIRSRNQNWFVSSSRVSSSSGISSPSDNKSSPCSQSSVILPPPTACDFPRPRCIVKTRCLAAVWRARRTHRAGRSAQVSCSAHHSAVRTERRHVPSRHSALANASTSVPHNININSTEPSTLYGTVICCLLLGNSALYPHEDSNMLPGYLFLRSHNFCLPWFPRRCPLSLVEHPCKFPVVYICQKLWKLDDSRQSYCKNYLAYLFWPTLYIIIINVWDSLTPTVNFISLSAFKRSLK